MKLNKIYKEAKDKYVAAVCLYVKASDTKAYIDPDYKTTVDKDTLKELFINGAVIVETTGTYKPISYTEKSGAGVLTYIKTGASNSATLATITSNEGSEK